MNRRYEIRKSLYPTLILGKRTFHGSIKPIRRIGPHDKNVISVIIGSLLGGGYAERLNSGGVKFRFRQSIAHKDYIFWLYNFFNSRGYCSNN